MQADRPTVSFTAMIDGTPEDYRLLEPYEQEELGKVPDRILGWLRDMDDHTGYQVTRLGHSLQAATRALRAGEDEEMVVCALVHDVGDMIAPANHSQAAAAIVRPYVSDRNHWTIPGTRPVPTSAPTTTRTPSTPTTRQSPWSSSSRWFDVSSTRVRSRAPTPTPKQVTSSPTMPLGAAPLASPCRWSSVDADERMSREGS
jgi:hypothetical protein